MLYNPTFLEFDHYGRINLGIRGFRNLGIGKNNLGIGEFRDLGIEGTKI
jgi:hypothetical protein